MKFQEDLSTGNVSGYWRASKPWSGAAHLLLVHTDIAVDHLDAALELLDKGLFELHLLQRADELLVQHGGQVEARLLQLNTLSKAAFVTGGAQIRHGTARGDERTEPSGPHFPTPTQTYRSLTSCRGSHLQDYCPETRADVDELVVLRHACKSVFTREDRSSTRVHIRVPSTVLWRLTHEADHLADERRANGAVPITQMKQCCLLDSCDG